jgi:hypothetical protein
MSKIRQQLLTAHFIRGLAYYIDGDQHNAEYHIAVSMNHFRHRNVDDKYMDYKSAMLELDK